MGVQFYEEARDSDLKYAVIAARYQGKWLFCRHRDRITWELPGGHREEGETIFDAAKRELWEETGALDFQLEPVAAYSYTYEGETSFGGLFYAEIRELRERPAEFEIGENRLFDRIPEEVTYPTIQPFLQARVESWLADGGFRAEEEDIMDMLV